MTGITILVVVNFVIGAVVGGAFVSALFFMADGVLAAIGNDADRLLAFGMLMIVTIPFLGIACTATAFCLAEDSSQS